MHGIERRITAPFPLSSVPGVVLAALQEVAGRRLAPESAGRDQSRSESGPPIVLTQSTHISGSLASLGAKADVGASRASGGKGDGTGRLGPRFEGEVGRGAGRESWWRRLGISPERRGSTAQRWPHGPLVYNGGAIFQWSHGISPSTFTSRVTVECRAGEVWRRMARDISRLPGLLAVKVSVHFQLGCDKGNREPNRPARSSNDIATERHVCTTK